MHLHTHDTPGGQLGDPARRDRRRGRRGRRRDRLDGRHHLAAAALGAGLRDRPLRPRDRAVARGGQRARALLGGRPAGSTRRSSPACRRPTGRVYRHEIPGGQLSNLRQQAIALGLGEKFEQIEDMYAAANDILGNVVKVTPSSKVVGDLALHLVAVGADPAEFAENPGKFDIPDSVIGFLNGELGDPPGGWPEPFRTKALEGRTWKEPAEARSPTSRPQGCGTQPPADPQRAAVPRARPRSSPRSGETYGDVSVLPTRDYLYGLRPGRGARGRARGGQDPDPRPAGDQRARRARLPHGDGHHQRPAAPDQRPRRVGRRRGRGGREGRPAKPGHVAAPFQGVVTLAVEEGDQVAAGDTVATIEAMKMEASITAPSPARSSGSRSPAPRRSTAATWCWCWPSCTARTGWSTG